MNMIINQVPYINHKNMKYKKQVLHIIGYLSVLLSSMMSYATKSYSFPSSYNIKWRTPSKNALASMPLSGRLGAGANVWVQDGSLWLYLGHNGAYDSQGRLLKLGCIRLTPKNKKLGENNFCQTLELRTGTIHINQKDLVLNIWFAGETLIIESQSKSNLSWCIEYGTWRDKDKNNILQDMFSTVGNFKADHVKQVESGLIWFHDNKDEQTPLDKLSKINGIPKADISDVVSNRIFGGALALDGGWKNVQEHPVAWQCWSGKAWSGETILSKKHRITISLGAGCGITPNLWREKAIMLLQDSAISKAKAEELKRWSEFWNRSYIIINKNEEERNEGHLVGRNYQLFRYMLACNRDAEFPLLFNGGIFTVDNFPNEITGNNNESLPTWEPGISTPDFRRWMGCSFMSQNQRWLGWPTLFAGDKDLLKPSLAFYRNRSHVAAIRAKNNGANGVVFPEPMDIWGLCCVTPLPNGLCGAEHLTYHFSMMLEHAWMALEAHEILGVSLENDWEWIVGTIRFYDSFYRKENKKRTGYELDKNGKLVLYPSNGLEYISGATNPIEVVCALKRITSALASQEELNESIRKDMKRIFTSIPDIPTGYKNSKKVLLPAQTFEKEHNLWEPIEMYAAMPYKLVGVTHQESIQLLKDTYESIPQHRLMAYQNDYSWMANMANIAAMAWPEEAEKRAIYKMANTTAPQARFPAFFGPGHDWIPDHNWGGSGMKGLQEMILQSDTYGDGKIYLLYSWPQKWNVDFKLHASQQTQIIGKVKNGKLISLEVFPRNRKEDVYIDPRFL